MVRRRHTAAAETLPEPEPMGPVRSALAKLVTERVEPAAIEAAASIQQAQLDHEKALECQAASPTDENTVAVHRTWIALQTAPAIEHRLSRVVLPRTKALVDSDDAREADQVLADAAERGAFLRALEERLDEVRKAAESLAAEIQAIDQLHAKHCSANALAKDRVAAVKKELATLVPDFDLEAAMPRDTLETVAPRSARLAIARRFKESFSKALGKHEAHQFFTALRAVS